MKRTVKHSCSGSRQTYMNKTKFDPNRHKKNKIEFNNEELIKLTSLCCHRCSSVINWKIEYGQYQPIKEKRKCNICHEKCIIYAYHHICQECAEKEARCAKCQKYVSQIIEEEPAFTQEKIAELSHDVLKCREHFEEYSSHNEEINKRVMRLSALDTRNLKSRLETELFANNQIYNQELRERDRRTYLRKSALNYVV